MAEVSIGSSSSCTEVRPDEERVLIRDIAIAAESSSKEGDTFYLITHRWWLQWIDYVNQDQPNNKYEGSSLSDHCDSSGSITSKRPSSIDNSDLIYDAALEDPNTGIEIHDTLQEGRDYVLLPQEVWNQLFLWYGGGPVLGRKVISSGLSHSELAVEVYPLRLQLLMMPKGERTALRISKKETIRELHRRACEIFNLKLQNVRIWDYFGHRKYALMNDMDKSLDDANFQMDQDILVEILESNAFGGRACSVQENGSIEEVATSALVEPSVSNLLIAGSLSTSKDTSRSCNMDLSLSHNLTSPIQEKDNAYGTSGVSTRGSPCGLTGLLNLGNTCFMNSAIQCLVHTPEFARYFREDYHQEINWQNPLGMVGELAVAFGDLLRKLWAPGRTPISPRPFKAKLARFASQFSGYNQHDSQELLAFLLDGLHEDLNRVKHKPYVKSRDADGRPDEEVADEYWSNHIGRNDSIIVDVCQGQYKSTLVCPVCNKVSVTFDPFMYLSLPLQFSTTRAMTVKVFTYDGISLPSTVTVTVPKQGRCKDLIQALKSSCSLKPTEELRLAEIKNHLVQRFLDDSSISLSTIKDDDHLAAYKIQKSLKNTLLIKLIHRRKDHVSGDSQPTARWKAFGTPLLSSIARDDTITKANLQALVQSLLFPYRKQENLECTDISNPSIPAARLSSRNRRSEAYTENISNLMDEEDVATSRILGSELLPLQLVDEKHKCIDLTMEEREVIKFGSSESVVIYVDWSHKLLEKYDFESLENLPEVVKYGTVTKKARTEPLSLYTCLEAFLREEPLVPEDMWNCPRCKERRQASKKLDLWRLPEVLVIHLKRFSYSRSTKHKLETFVNFPIHDFDLTKYVANKNTCRQQLYELYALINHYGSMGSGHYTAHIKLLNENRWYNFDDSHISLINEEDVKSGAAYVLFYRRVKIDASSSNVPPLPSGRANKFTQH